MFNRRPFWLAIAKSLPVGGTKRVRVPGDTRPNLVVGNDADKYWCYHHSKKYKGDVVPKTHVKLQGQAPVSTGSLTPPTDLMELRSLPRPLQEEIAAFLATKGVDLTFLPNPVLFSNTRKRLYLSIYGELYGRDLTGRSPQKWIAHGKRGYAWMNPTIYSMMEAPMLCITEDLFSMYKVAWATDVPCFCSLGTTVRDDLVVLLSTHYRGEVAFVYDGDDAGRRGAMLECARLRTLGITAGCVYVPVGVDPKDMSAEQLRELILGD